MAFSYVASSVTPTSSKTANQSSIAIGGSTAALWTAGRLVVVGFAMDNNQTTDGDEGAVSGVVDTRLNTWAKAREFCYGRGAAQGGATMSVWWSLISNSMLNGDAITATLTNTASRDATAAIALAFDLGAGNTVSVEATNASGVTGGDPNSLNAVTANIECVRLRFIAGETDNTTVLTNTASWDDLNMNPATAGGSAVTNMAARMEYIISTGTGAASDPTWTAMDNASVYVAFKEVVTAARVPKSIPMTMQPYLAQ